MRHSTPDLAQSEIYKHRCQRGPWTAIACWSSPNIPRISQAQPPIAAVHPRHRAGRLALSSL